MGINERGSISLPVLPLPRPFSPVPDKSQRRLSGFPRALSGGSLRSALDRSSTRSSQEMSPRIEFQRRMDASESSASSSSTSSLETLGRHGGKKAERIALRSSSKEVKNALARMKELAPGSLPPMKDLDMLCDLATDSFYRVIITKAHGKEIMAQIQERFPANAACIKSCKTVLTLLQKPNNDNTSLETTKGVASASKRRWRSASDSPHLLTTLPPTPVRDDDDIIQIINRECRLLVETTMRR